MSGKSVVLIIIMTLMTIPLSARDEYVSLWTWNAPASESEILSYRYRLDTTEWNTVDGNITSIALRTPLDTPISFEVQALSKGKAWSESSITTATITQENKRRNCAEGLKVLSKTWENPDYQTFRYQLDGTQEGSWLYTSGEEALFLVPKGEKHTVTIEKQDSDGTYAPYVIAQPAKTKGMEVLVGGGYSLNVFSWFYSKNQMYYQTGNIKNGFSVYTELLSLNETRFSYGARFQYTRHQTKKNLPYQTLFADFLFSGRLFTIEKIHTSLFLSCGIGPLLSMYNSALTTGGSLFCGAKLAFQFGPFVLAVECSVHFECEFDYSDSSLTGAIGMTFAPVSVSIGYNSLGQRRDS